MTTSRPRFSDPARTDTRADAWTDDARIEGRPSALPLAAYRTAVALDEPFRPSASPAPADRLDEHVRAALRLLGTDRAVSQLGLR